MTRSGLSAYSVRCADCASEIVVRATDGTDAVRKARLQGYRLDKERLTVVCDGCRAKTP